MLWEICLARLQITLTSTGAVVKLSLFRRITMISFAVALPIYIAYIILKQKSVSVNLTGIRIEKCKNH